MASNDITKYPGKDINVTWDGRLCIHIGECGRAKGDLFVGGRKPWCQPDLASDDDVHEVLGRQRVQIEKHVSCDQLHGSQRRRRIEEDHGRSFQLGSGDDVPKAPR